MLFLSEFIELSKLPKILTKIGGTKSDFVKDKRLCYNCLGDTQTVCMCA